MKNPFSITKINEFVDSKQKELHINYLGRPFAAAFLFNNQVHLDFTETQPGIQPDEWRFLTKICNHLQKNEIEFLLKCKQ